MNKVVYVSIVYNTSQVKIWQNIFLPNFYHYLTNDWGIAIFRKNSLDSSNNNLIRYHRKKICLCLTKIVLFSFNPNIGSAIAANIFKTIKYHKL